jgi:glycosyltransferase involved in cell wall biosynthesis
MGLVLAEAAAAGLPLVATEVGGTSQVVRHGENGYLMPYDAGAGEWARAILELLADGPKRLRFGEAARALAEREFSQEALRENVEWALEAAAR